MKKNGFAIKKKNLTKTRSKRYLAETITDAHYTGDLALPENIHFQTNSLLHILEQAARGVGLYVNSDKTQIICLNKRKPFSH